MDMPEPHSTPQPSRGSTPKPKIHKLRATGVIGPVTISSARIRRIPAETPPDRKKQVAQILRAALDIVRVVDMVGRWLGHWLVHLRRRLGTPEV